MNIKRITIIVTILLLIALFSIFYLFRSANESKLDPVAVNDIVQSVNEQWGKLDASKLPCMEYQLEYVVINAKGIAIAATREGLDENLSSAIANRDTVIDIRNGDVLLGKVIIYNDTGKRWQNYRNNLFIITSVIVVLIIVFILIYGLYIDRLIFRPFRTLQAFAKNVAEGDLDIPLTMDRGNMFGAFTESFDLLRDELALARENEEKAKQSKKEL
ncbi:MAG: sensor histidine kinase, partial [Bacillota bacterium]|nr:sensor histidine kinase [Bacillota bacterium]